MPNKLINDIENNYKELNKILNDNYEKTFLLGQSSVLSCILQIIQDNKNDINTIKKWVELVLENNEKLKEYTYSYIENQKR